MIIWSSACSAARASSAQRYSSQRGSETQGGGTVLCARRKHLRALSGNKPRLSLIETKLGRTQQSPTIAARLANPLHLAVRLSTRTFRGLDVSVALSIEFGGSWRIGAHVRRQPLTALPMAIPAAIHKRGGEATSQLASIAGIEAMVRTPCWWHAGSTYCVAL